MPFPKKLLVVGGLVVSHILVLGLGLWLANWLMEYHLREAARSFIRAGMSLGAPDSGLPAELHSEFDLPVGLQKKDDVVKFFLAAGKALAMGENVAADYWFGVYLLDKDCDLATREFEEQIKVGPVSFPWPTEEVLDLVAERGCLGALDELRERAKPPAAL